MTPVTPPGAIALRIQIRARSKDFVARAGTPRPARNLDSKPANCAADHRMLMGHQNALRATVNRGSRFDALDLASLARVPLDGLKSRPGSLACAFSGRGVPLAGLRSPALSH